MIYVWSLRADCPCFAARLFARCVLRHPLAQKSLVVVPPFFRVIDGVKNAFFNFFFWTFPTLSPMRVSAAYLITCAKYVALRLTWVEGCLFATLAVIGFVARFIESKSGFLATAKTQ